MLTKLGDLHSPEIPDVGAILKKGNVVAFVNLQIIFRIWEENIKFDNTKNENRIYMGNVYKI